VAVAPGKPGCCRRKHRGGDSTAIDIRTQMTGGPQGEGGSVPRTKRKKVKLRVRATFGGIEKMEDGELDQKKLYRLIRRKKSAVQMCYERELKKNPGLSGKLRLRLTIALNGRVHELEFDTNTLNARVASCVRSLFKRWRFPRPKGSPVTVVLPFLFEAR